MSSSPRFDWLAACVVLLAASGCGTDGVEPELTDVAVQSVSGGYWDCWKSGWWAGTTYRSMSGATRFECGGGICDDDSHTQPLSWVDICGGVSQKQNDRSDSFRGPQPDAEWNGCTTALQESTGVASIEDVNQSWDRWPTAWVSGRYAVDDLTFLNDYSVVMHGAFASIYDMDCAPSAVSWLWGGSCPKEIVGTIYYPDFSVSSHLVEGEPTPASGYARWDIGGISEIGCSTPANACETTLCSDLHVASTFECVYVCDPEQGCDPSASIDSCTTCSADCPCPSGMTCTDGACSPEPEMSCGNGACEGDENCDNCSSDCDCGSDQTCPAEWPDYAQLDGECVPSCGAAGGNVCESSLDACAGHDLLVSYDCSYCCSL